MVSARSVPRVGIVGAGIAGLRCGQALREHGCEIALFDRGRRPGGRCASRRIGALHADHGAQYLTARSPNFRAALPGWIADGALSHWDPRGLDPEERFVGVPGMRGLAERMARGLGIEQQVRAQALVREAGWRIRFERGDAGPFDAVVIATAAPQAAPLLDVVPALQRSLARVSMAPCQAALVAFDASLALDHDAAFVTDSPLAWVARNGSKPGRPGAPDCWTLHATPAWSRARLELPPDEVARALLDAFRDHVGRALPEVRALSGHRWRWALAETPLGAPFLWDGEARIGVCGDWCIGARIEAAWQSGTALAAQIAAELG